MLVLGIDPGTIKMGWGVVSASGSRMTRVDSGTLLLGRGDTAGRLVTVWRELQELMQFHQPDVLSLERNFVSRNPQSAFRIGEARGVVMAASAYGGVELEEYSPASVKKAVAGHGRADKQAMIVAVSRMLSLVDTPAEDEADALALAACHILRHGYDRKVAGALDAARGTRRSRGRAGVARR